MLLHIHADAAALAKALAGHLAHLIQAQPEALLVLPSGRSPEALYELLGAQVRSGALRTQGLGAFALDEIVGLGPEDPASYAHYHRTRIWEPWGLAKARCGVPNGKASNLEAEATRYAQAFRAAGPAALALLGLGTNAHVAFNEPGPTHLGLAGVVRLAPGSAEGAAWGLTLSLAEIGACEQVWLMASGAHKAPAVAAMLEGPLDPLVPASLLRIHPRLVVHLDEAAASGLSHRGHPGMP